MPPPLWINQQIENEKDSQERYSAKIVFKGPCDLELLSAFLHSDNIIKEFTYIGYDRNNCIEHHNHSINYLNLPFLGEDEKNMLIDECIFNDKDVFKTSLYDDDVKLIFLSTLIEPHLGIYRRKGTDIEIAFGEWCYPLTDEENWSALLKGEVNNFQNNYTKQWLKEFSEKYEFVGRLTEEQIINNIKLLLRRVSNEVHICLLLGSETPYLKNHQKAYEGRESIHSRINKQVKDLAKNEPRLHYLDMNDYIVDQASFIDNINHYQRQIYYSASKKANKIIAEVCGQKIEEKGRIALIIEIIAGIINRNLQPSNPLFKPLQWIYHKITINRRL